MTIGIKLLDPKLVPRIVMVSEVVEAADRKMEADAPDEFLLLEV